MKRMTLPSDLTTSSITALSRSSNSPRNLEPATRAPRSRARSFLFLSESGTSPDDDAPGEALDDGGLADARLADEHGVVLGAAGEDLHDAADLLVAADHRVELLGAGEGGEVAAVALQDAVLLLGRLVGDPPVAAHCLERGENGRPW